MCLLCPGTSELLTYIQWCWPHRVMFWGICLRVSGGSTREEFTLMGPKLPGILDPPQVLRWASVFNHLSILSGETLPSVSQSFGWGLRWWGDSVEAVRSGRASTCASTLIPHAGGDLSWAGRSSSGWKRYFSLLQLHICVHLCAIHLWCMSTQKYAWEKDMYIDIYFLSMTKTKLSFILHTAIKRKMLLAWRDSKHVSWKIYGSLELNCWFVIGKRQVGDWAETCFINLISDVCLAIGVMQHAFYCNSTFDLEVSVFGRLWWMLPM